MPPEISQSPRGGANAYGSVSDGLVYEPEEQVLRRLAGLVEHLFRVPVAYFAFLGADLCVLKRLGSGEEYWPDLSRFPLAPAVAQPKMWRAPEPSDVPGFVPGKIRFAASAPLRSSDGLELGVLVIADVAPRPEFGSNELDAFAELAAVLAGKMELRMLTCQARETRALLRETERRFRNMANAAPVLIIYSGLDGGGCFVNKAWLEFTGREFSEELGDGFAETFHPDYRDAVVQKYLDAFEARRPHTQEFPMLRHDGEYRWMVSHGIPRVEQDGTFVGYIGCLIDMTERRAALADLRLEKQLTDAVARASETCCLLLDRDGRIERVCGIGETLLDPRGAEPVQAPAGSESRAPLGQAVSGLRGRFVWNVSRDLMPTGPDQLAAAWRGVHDRSLVEVETSSADRDLNLAWRFDAIHGEDGELSAVAVSITSADPTERLPSDAILSCVVKAYAK